MMIARVLREEGTTTSSFYSLREPSSFMFCVFYSLRFCGCFSLDSLLAPAGPGVALLNEDGMIA